ncbi:MAG: aminotransferase class I/II-fold pyridoxal phosphate-dependent enzyme [Ruminococcus sp.]|nr:aminotransferase class I/II-fold pyridoxal phosphate-dependent enzyme [Ruminococcus sp.]
MLLTEMNKDQLIAFKNDVQKEYDDFKNQGLSLNMARGKPSSSQLDLAMKMLAAVNSYDADYKASDGTDCRNYGGLDGIIDAKNIFSQMLGVSNDEIIVCGNSSLNIMYDTIAKCIIFGVDGVQKPWKDYEKIKWLCPAPGYDRHFAICESFGIEMITIPLNEDGPDMDMIEKLVAEDDTIKGIWCVPMYSNPTGITYSDETVKRFANLKPAAKDFRIFWDNAYCIHHLTDTPDTLLNILDECKKAGNDDMVYMFASTSKITFAGGGIAVMATSKANVDYIKSLMTVQTIGFDKINQLRHAKFFGDYNGLMKQMDKHREILQPKFEMVLDTLDREIAPLGIGRWHKPRGGYFVSFDTIDGCAKRVCQLCKEAGVVLTGAGATFPYGKDAHDSNIRIAPSFPPVEELELAMKLFVTAVKLATAEKLLESK